MRPSLLQHPRVGLLHKRSVRLLAGTTLAITGCLAFAVPAANAASAAVAPRAAGSAALASATIAAASTSAPASLTAAAAVSGTHEQTLSVSDQAASAHVVEDTFTATPPDVTALLQQAAPQLDPATLASTAAALGALPGQRLTIVGTALSYLGTPYVLGGASHSGIDCSGLTLVAYQTVGIQFLHYVSAQDAVGHTIAAADARPGDLLVFDDEQHVAIYLGNGLLVAAREPGTNVQVEPLSNWSGVAYHFTRVLGD